MGDWVIEQLEDEHEENLLSDLAHDAACRVIINKTPQAVAIAAARSFEEDFKQACDSCTRMESSDDNAEAYMTEKLPYNYKSATSKQKAQIFEVSNKIRATL